MPRQRAGDPLQVLDPLQVGGHAFRARSGSRSADRIRGANQNPQWSDRRDVIVMRCDSIDDRLRLAAALDLMTDHPLWHLTIIGDGPAKREIRALFERFDPKSIAWAGEIASEKIAKFLYDADLYVWPGCGEAYGLAYLEAEAAGLPVIAQNTAGVPEVVRDGETGMLTPDGDAAAYAGAILGLLADPARRNCMSKAARSFVLEERSLSVASARLQSILEQRLRR